MAINTEGLSLGEEFELSNGDICPNCGSPLVERTCSGCGYIMEDPASVEDPASASRTQGGVVSINRATNRKNPPAPTNLTMSTTNAPGGSPLAAESVVEDGETKYIKKRGKKWVLLQKGTGKVIGTHDTREKALGQLRAIEYHKHNEGVDSMSDLYEYNGEMNVEVPGPEGEFYAEPGEEPAVAPGEVELTPQGEYRCPECGQECPPDANFCPHCGTALDMHYEDAAPDADPSNPNQSQGGVSDVDHATTSPDGSPLPGSLPGESYAQNFGSLISEVRWGIDQVMLGKNPKDVVDQLLGEITGTPMKPQRNLRKSGPGFVPSRSSFPVHRASTTLRHHDIP